MKQCLLVVILLLTTASVHADAPKIDKRSSGLYLQQFRNENLAYIVDPYAQMCFAATITGGGITEISCYDLSRRPGWSAVIKWAAPEGEAPAETAPQPR